jgi:hypothetical protein
VLASGRAHRLSGRYIHAEHDDIEDLIAHAGQIVANNSHAIGLHNSDLDVSTADGSFPSHAGADRALATATRARASVPIGCQNSDEKR